MVIEYWEVLLQQILECEILQVVLVHLFHVKTLQFFSKDESDHRFECEDLRFVCGLRLTAHYLVKDHRDVVDTLAVTCLGKHLGAYRVKNSQVSEHIIL